MIFCYKIGVIFCKTCHKMGVNFTRFCYKIGVKFCKTCHKIGVNEVFNPLNSARISPKKEEKINPPSIPIPLSNVLRDGKC